MSTTDHREAAGGPAARTRLGRRAATLALLLGASLRPALAQTGERLEFAAVVRAHFQAWDLNHDGRIEAAEIDRLMNAPGIQGPAAAALATLKAREHATPAAERARFAVTLDELDRPQAPRSVVDGPHKHPTDQQEFERKLTSLRSLIPELYAQGRPQFASLHQGPAGDCYFFSITGWLAARQPGRIERMIEPQADGSFVVRFFDGEAYRVPAPTEAEMIAFNSGSTLSDGCWITVLEKAIGERMRGHIRDPRSSKRTAEAVDAMAAGGDQGMIIHLYTGHRVRSLALRDPREERVRLEELRRLLPETLGAGRIAGVGMAPHPAEGHPRVPKLGYNHAYAILDYDSRSELVTDWNPWGENFEPSGPQGPQHGYRTEHGVFRVPLVQFYHVFSKVHLETPEIERLRR